MAGSTVESETRHVVRPLTAARDRLLHTRNPAAVVRAGFSLFLFRVTATCQTFSGIASAALPSVSPIDTRTEASASCRHAFYGSRGTAGPVTTKRQSSRAPGPNENAPVGFTG